MNTAQPAPAPVPPVRPTGNGAFATIAELLRGHVVITSSDAQQATGLDAAGVRPHLQRLVSEGLAVTEGQRRGMRYRRVDG
jgi:predicted ArsR family transcriptional regulator